jgi:hypothetical protein
MKRIVPTFALLVRIVTTGQAQEKPVLLDAWQRGRPNG